MAKSGRSKADAGDAKIVSMLPIAASMAEGCPVGTQVTLTVTPAGVRVSARVGSRMVWSSPTPRDQARIERLVAEDSQVVRDILDGKAARAAGGAR